MKKGFVIALTLLLLCLTAVTAGAADTGLTSLGINGNYIDIESGTAEGDGWTLTRNRAQGTHTLALNEGSFNQITVRGNLLVYIPAGASITVGRSSGTYGLGVENGSLTFNGTGTLNLVGTAALYAKDASARINGTTIVASGKTYGAYIHNGSLTLNGGELTATGSKYGVYSNGGLAVNGGILNAAATDTAANDTAGIYLRDCRFTARAGIVNAQGSFAIQALSAQAQLSGADVTATGSSDGFFGSASSELLISAGRVSFGGKVNGVELTGGSGMTVSGGNTTATVTTATFSSFCYGIYAEKSDLLVTGGMLTATGYSGVYLSGDASAGAAGSGGTLTLAGGFLKAVGDYAGVRVYNASMLVADGVLVTAATDYAGLYLNYSDLRVSGGTVSSVGGPYGIYGQSAPLRIDGGTVFADGSQYGVFSLTAAVVVNGGRVCANGGNIGINVSGSHLTVGETNTSVVSCLATGGSWAVAGSNPNASGGGSDLGVVLYGRSYSYKTQLNYKILSLSDGEIVYSSASSCALFLNGSPVDRAAALVPGAAAYNDGGSEASYLWKLANENGSYVLTLNNANLSALSLIGSLTIRMEKGSANRISGGLEASYGLLRTQGDGSLAVSGGEGDAVTLTNAACWLREGTLDLQAGVGNGNGINAFNSNLLVTAPLTSSVRAAAVRLRSSRAAFLEAAVTAVDCESAIRAENSELLFCGGSLQATNATSYALSCATAALTLNNTRLTTTGAAGIHAASLTAADTSLQLTAATGRGIYVRDGGLTLRGCAASVTALGEAVYAESAVRLIDTGLSAVSNSNTRAVLLNAPVGSAAAISVSGHCLVTSGGDPVRNETEQGLVSYFKNGDTASTTVVVSNAHNYGIAVRYDSCAIPCTGLYTCTFTGCTCALCAQTDALEHDFSNYKSDENATCERDGTKTALCSLCGLVKRTVSDIGSSKPHTYTTYRSDGNATCTEDGTKSAVCTVCKAYTDTVDDVGSALGHDHVRTVLVPANCSKKGTDRFICSRCDDYYDRESVEYGGHVWTAVDCYSMRHCAECGEADGQILAHDFSAGFIYDGDATCTLDGHSSAVCSRCGEKVTVDAPGTALGHSPMDIWQIVRPANAFTEGLRQLYCRRCGRVIRSEALPLIAVPTDESPYLVDDETMLIRHIIPGTTVQTLAAGLQNSLHVAVSKSDGTVLAADALCGTGCTLSVRQSVAVYTLVVAADPDGDGQITASDARLALRCAVGLEPTISAAALEAADIDSDGQITASDARTLLRMSVGLDPAISY